MAKVTQVMIQWSSRAFDVPSKKLDEFPRRRLEASVRNEPCCKVQDLAGFRGLEAVATDPPSAGSFLPGDVTNLNLVGVMYVNDGSVTEWADRCDTRPTSTYSG